ncbi:MAG TPA: hypothetical protein VKV02_01825 [Acidobacteriaceae bacterium]|nr:hypothetical protein [Acidobacteriaceae bacterium]
MSSCAEHLPGEIPTAIFQFLETIGIPVSREAIAGETFLPGLKIAGGVLLVDEDRLLYPGDILHEAGHLAVMTRAERAACDGNAGPDAGAEMAAIAWSYAAALAIGLDPHVVFHAEGYKNGGAQLVESFAEGRYIGAPLLAWYGLTHDPLHGGVLRSGDGVYPKMLRWVR